MDIANPALKLKKKRRRLLLFGVGVLLVVAAVAGLMALGPPLPTAQRSSLWIGTVSRGDLLKQVRAAGSLVPRHSRWLAAATSARVAQILVLPGAKVTPGTVLLKLENPEVMDALRNAKARVAAAEADVAARRATLKSQLLDQRSALAQARAAYAKLKVKVEADAKAMQLHLVPRVRFQQEQIALKQLKERKQIEQQRVAAFDDTRRAQMAAVKAHLAQRRSNLKLRRRQADALVVRAGIAGVLQQLAVQEGEQLAEGAKLARVTRLDDLIARLKVPEVQAQDVALGMPVTVDTHNGKVDGKVTRIDPAVVEGSVVVDVSLTGELPDGARPKLSVDGRIRIARLDDVLSLGRPSGARPHASISLFRLDAGGDIARRVPVDIGAVSVDRVQVRAGLKPGDQVILSATSRWDDYDRIRIE